MPDSIFSVVKFVAIALLFFLIVCVFVCVCVCVCVCLEVILVSFNSYRQGAQYFHYYISQLAETLSYNGLRQVGLITLK